MSHLWERLPSRDLLFRWPFGLPVVLYHGEAEWRAARDVGDLVEAPGGLEPFQPRLRYWLCDLGRYGDEELRGAAVLRASFLVLKHIFGEGVREALPRALRMLAEVAGTRTGLETVEVLLRYVVAATDRVEAEDIREALARELGPKGEAIMPTLAEKWIEEGMAKGLQQGLQQGLVKGRLEAAREDVLDALEARFGAVPGDVVDRVQGVEDLAKLKVLLRQAVRAEDLEAFRQALQTVLG